MEPRLNQLPVLTAAQTAFRKTFCFLLNADTHRFDQPVTFEPACEIHCLASLQCNPILRKAKRAWLTPYYLNLPGNFAAYLGALVQCVTPAVHGATRVPWFLFKIGFCHEGYFVG